LDLAGQTLLGKYELTRMLGKGGMGEVWEGEHALTGRRVAVKILAERYLSNKKVVARFGREARAASAVQHDGIVEILDQDRTDSGIPFLVMEFLEGESVGQRIKRLGGLSQDDTMAIMLPLLDALDAAHQAGVIHRDLKPDNVFILPGARGEERIKILDFGISQKADEIEHHLTQEGSVLGTPHYMSPEQARGEPNIDGRVDVYAVGVMFYECVVGDVPFDANNYNALLQIILGRPPPSPRGKGAEISPAIEQVVLAAMDKERDRRPPTARAFHNLLLEAGMQEEDALLDVASWTFSTPSGPPPPIDFGPDEFKSDPPVQASEARGDAHKRARDSADDMFPHLPAGFDDASFAPAPGKPAKPQPAQPAAAARGPAPERPGPAPALGRGALPGQRPQPAPRPNEMPMFAAEPGSRGAFAAEPGTGPRGAFLAESGTGARGAFLAEPGTGPRGAFLAEPGTGPRGPLLDTAQPARKEAQRRAAERAPQVAQAAEESTPPAARIARTVVGWVFALAALAALAYLANTVFTRPDPRKSRRAQDPSAQQAP
jgi:serine/threonine protein kinase